MSAQDSRPHGLMLEECFAAADNRFLDEWIRLNSSEDLIRFLEHWLVDPRPWARQQVIRYLQGDLNLPGHEVVVKRLCRHFYAAGDHEMMAYFMVAFDRFVRRMRVTRAGWKPETRTSDCEDHLFAKPNRTIQNETGRTVEWGIGPFKRTVPLPDRLNSDGNRLFRHRTRNHLRRKVWRYFRWLTYRDPDAYLEAITTAVTQYRDNDFAVGENIVDNWSLMHVCYFHSDILRFSAAHTNLRRGSSLSDLLAAPYQPEVWQRPEATERLLQILKTAGSTLVRVWAIELLQRDHRDAMQRMNAQLLLPLLSHADPRVQQFASGVFEQHQKLASLPVTTWLELLVQSDDSQLPMICAAMKSHVSVAGLDTQQLVQLASVRPASAAEFGFHLLKTRHKERPLSIAEVTTLSGARCEAISGEITRWALSVLGSDGYQTDDVIEFFDSQSVSMRSASITWLEQPASRGYNDPALWARLIETPFDDVRLRVIECLHRRASLPGTETDALAPIWSAVILGVHRGGRTKRKAIAQVQAAILSQPARAAELLPVLAVAVRSLRAPERRCALAAVAAMVAQNAELQTDIQRQLPELQWIDGPS